MTTLRLSKLPDKRLQLTLSMVFVGAVAFALLFQFILLTSRMTAVADELGPAGSHAVEQMMKLLPETLLLTFGVILPATLLLGILATFRIAGPLTAIRRQLKALREGEATTPLTLRKGDALQDLCRELNEATAPLLQEKDAELSRKAA